MNIKALFHCETLCLWHFHEIWRAPFSEIQNLVVPLFMKVSKKKSGNKMPLNKISGFYMIHENLGEITRIFWQGS